MNWNEIAFPFFLTLLAGLSTVGGGLFVLTQRCRRKSRLAFWLGLSAGVMIYLSFVELLPAALASLGFFQANIYFFAGIILMALVDFFLPHHYLEERICRRQTIIDPGMMSTGLVVAFGLAIHNIPEGMAVFLSSFGSLRLGLLLALAIAIHNIPEGIAVAAPIYHATGSRRKALKYAFFSGIAEPAGALIAYFLLRPYLNASILAMIFSVVAGIMVYISFDELLPASFRDNQGHRAMVGVIAGMMIVAVSLFFL